MNKYFSIKSIYKFIVFSIAIIILFYMLFQTSDALKIIDWSNLDNLGVSNFEDDNFDKNSILDNDNNMQCQANTSTSEVVLEASTLRVLYSKNADLKMEMASTTKIMTALVVIENMPLDKEVRIPDEAVGIEGSSIYLGYNEIWTIQDLLYGLMLRSGNDSATALAIATAGSIDAFVCMMNDKAKDMGLTNTSFDNPHGLHSDKHYTSAYDLAVISAKAMQNSVFEKIVSTKSYTTQENDTHEKQVFINKNKMLFNYDGANGIKTGYTTSSGRCLVSSAKRNDMQIVCVVLNCYDMWNESMRILDSVFDEYRPYLVAKENEVVAEFDCEGEKYNIAMQNDLVLPLKNSDSISCEGYFDIDINTEVPLKSGSVIGKIRFFDNNHLLFEANIVNIEEINNIGVLQKLSNFVGQWNVNNINGEIEQVFSFDRSGF